MNGLFDIAAHPIFLRILGIVLGISGILLWFSLVVWTVKDIRERSKDILAVLISCLLVLILNIPGFLIYLLLRPQETISQKYEKALEEEALLQEIKIVRRCSTCGAVSQPDWLVCPVCQQRLRKRCDRCAAILDEEWAICPYCEAKQE